MHSSGRPQVVAHRGASQANPEHTLGAYLAALDEGADALECDVRLTADGHLVCVHDRRIDRTANGHGLVSTMELTQLDELDFASWKNPWAELDDEAPEVDVERRRVLTLERLCQAVADYDRPVELAIETKHPTRYAGLVERRLVEVLDSFGWAGKDGPVRVMSFSPRALRRVRRLVPDLDVVILIDRLVLWQWTRRMVGRDWILGPGVDLLRAHARFRERLARSRRRVHVWTANSPEEFETCIDVGAEAVITDTPARALRYFQGRV